MWLGFKRGHWISIFSGIISFNSWKTCCSYGPPVTVRDLGDLGGCVFGLPRSQPWGCVATVAVRDTKNLKPTAFVCPWKWALNAPKREGSSEPTHQFINFQVRSCCYFRGGGGGTVTWSDYQSIAVHFQLKTPMFTLTVIHFWGTTILYYTTAHNGKGKETKKSVFSKGLQYLHLFSFSTGSA